MQWEELIAWIDRSATSERAGDASTLANVAALAAHGERSLVSPSEIGDGYYPTIILSWNNPPIQVEVCQDHFEVYDFREVPAKIQHIAENPDGRLPEQLLTLLEPLTRSS